MPTVRMGANRSRKQSRNRGLLLIALGLSVSLWILEQNGGALQLAGHAREIWSTPDEISQLRAELKEMRGKK